MHKLPSYRIIAFFLSGLILCIAFACVCRIGTALYRDRPDAAASPRIVTADIYQDGSLLMSIPLDPNAEIQTFTVSFGEADYNEIQIENGRIGVLSASCPDQLCVRQGFQDSPLLPIVCLPNRLTIQIRETDDTD
ncbi:MAG: NusG domain II-containing protein [Candidatus Gastranaerophilales bacterium]|nr:NusG domain II-containing protein [Candidatus Gastranaerophilales bacterium]